MSIAQAVRQYLKNKPYVKEALEKGIVNLSSLSRQIQTELGVRNFEAIKAAIRRSSKAMKKARQNREEKVLGVLKKSKMTTYDGDVVVITDEAMDVIDKFRVNLGQNWIYLVEKDQILNENNHILRKTENCTTIIIDSPEDIEEIPGVISYLTSVLAEQDVNIFEFVSCWKYTLIVLNKKDTLKAYELLTDLIG